MANVLVIAEQHRGEIAPAVYATMGAAKQLADNFDVLYASRSDALASVLAKREGVKTVWVANHPCFAHILAEDLAPLIVAMAKDYTHILAPADTFGKNLLPRVAACLNVAQISDLIAMKSETVFIRPIYAGNAFQTVESHDPIKVMTVRPTAFEAVAENAQTAEIKAVPYPIVPSEKVRFKGEEAPPLTRPELTSARVIVAGGRGLKSAENFKMIESLADKLGAAIGATRAVVDAGFVPNDWQVGQTGKVVAPTLYIAVGISGAIQHLAGMKDSKIIVAINQDPEAPIFQVADYGLVGDLFEILPALEKLI